MAVSLAQAKYLTQDDVQKGVIDEFRKSSFIFDTIIFDNVVAPTGGGSFTYGYQRVVTEGSAAVRALNAEYVAAEATSLRYTVDLKVLGGSYEIDRALDGMGGLEGVVAYQLTQKIKAAKALFNNLFINGDSGTTAEEFDGLDLAITGSSTEHDPGEIDLSSSVAIDTNWKTFLDELEYMLSLMDGKPSFLGGNSKLITKIKSVARRAGYLTQSEDSFGRKVSAYDDIPLVDLGAKNSSTDPVVEIAAATGYTSLYAGKLALDGIHAASKAGVSPVQSWLPDFKTAGAVKKGEVEMVCAIILRATKAAGVLRSIKVQ